jgi:hypothetical protein
LESRKNSTQIEANLKHPAIRIALKDPEVKFSVAAVGKYNELNKSKVSL